MPQDRTRKIVIAGVLGAIDLILGMTHLGFIPWFGTSLTILAVPVIIGAILEGPAVGAVIGLIFGLTSMLQAAVAPTGPGDLIFTNPLIAVLPRLFIGPVAWLVWRGVSRWPAIGLILTGIAGSLTNTVLVIGVIGLLGVAPWAVLLPLVVTNGFPEAGAAAVLTLAVVAAWKRIEIGRQGAAL